MSPIAWGLSSLFSFGTARMAGVIRAGKASLEYAEIGLVNVSILVVVCVFAAGRIWGSRRR